MLCIAELPGSARTEHIVLVHHSLLIPSHDASHHVSALTFPGGWDLFRFSYFYLYALAILVMSPLRLVYSLPFFTSRCFCSDSPARLAACVRTPRASPPDSRCGIVAYQRESAARPLFAAGAVGEWGVRRALTLFAACAPRRLAVGATALASLLAAFEVATRARFLAAGAVPQPSEVTVAAKSHRVEPYFLP
ncbi:hypothetical protein C8J57DRAFT_1716512 [Mycena rebaudengoi]|nr:hypothetical protein C8J57DRAFT_1716512 [Mycena rebaudengoi]